MHKARITTHSLRRSGRSLSIELWHNAGAGALIFYPGTMMCPFQYRPLLSALHAAGFAVAALHLTGHGTNPHFVGFSFDDLLRDGLDAEQWLREAGYNAIAVCGHSQGGILTLAHAAATKGLTAALPISGILPQEEACLGLTHFSRFTPRRQRLTAILEGVAGIAPRLPLPLPAYLSLSRVFSGAHKVNLNRRKCRWAYPLRFLLSLLKAHIEPDLHCPLFFYSARDDALFTLAQVQHTFELLRAPHKELHWLPQGGHMAVMSPGICAKLAAQAATDCARLGLPLRPATAVADDQGNQHGL